MFEIILKQINTSSNNLSVEQNRCKEVVDFLIVKDISMSNKLNIMIKVLSKIRNNYCKYKFENNKLCFYFINNFNLINNKSLFINQLYSIKIQYLFSLQLLISC